MNEKRSRRSGGCFAEIIFPMILLLAVGVILIYSAGASTPKLDFKLAGKPAVSHVVADQPASQPSASQPAGSLAAYTSGVRRWESKILEWERRFNIDRYIIATIMQIETCGENVRGAAGEYGLFQVMPLHFSGVSGDPMDPDVNAAVAMGFFMRVHEYMGYNVYMSFAGYNGGYAVANTGYQNWNPRTQTYYTLAKGIYDDMKAGLNPSPTIVNGIIGSGRCPP